MIKYCLVCFCLAFSYLTVQAQEQSSDLYAQQREQLLNKIEKHPFTQDLENPKRLPNGKLPPDMYFMQEYLQTMDPVTGTINPEILPHLKKRISMGDFTNELGTDDFFMRIPGSSEDPWISRGPFSTGGRTRALMFDPNDPTGKRVFAGGTSGGLWVNDDITVYNSQWQSVSNYWDNNAISCIAADPNNPLVMYVGTGEVYVGGNAGLGIYKTEDAGETWTHIFDDTFGYTSNHRRRGNYYITDIAVRDNNGQSEVYVGVAGRQDDVFIGNYEAGLYKSVDGGNSFERLEDFYYTASVSTDLDVYYNINRIEIGADNSLWVGTMNDAFSATGIGGKVFHSSDGVNFDLIFQENTNNQESGRVELGLSHQNPNVAYILLENYDSNAPVKILKTENGGNSWMEKPLPEDYDSGIPANDFTRGQSFYDLVIAVDPRDDDKVYVGGIDIFRSVDGAESWEQISKWANFDIAISYAHADQHAIVFNPNDPQQMLFGNDGGVFYTPDNSSFVQVSSFNKPILERNLAYNITQFYSARFDPTANANDEVIVGGTQDNGTIILSGSPNNEGVLSTTPFTGGDGGQVEFDDEGAYLINGYVYANHYLTNISTNNLFYLLPENERYTGSFINEITLDKNLDVAFVNRSQTTINVVNGLNGANSTDDLELHRYNINSFSGYITKLAVSPYTTTSSTLYVGTLEGRLYKVSNANSEEDATHVEIDSPIIGAISEIEFGPSENHLIVTVSNYNVPSVWYTEDGGITWNNKEGDLPDLPVRTVKVNPENNNEVILGTDLGVWSTNNFMSDNVTWTTSNNGMSFVKVLEFDYRESDKTLLAATYGRGIFSTENAFLGTNEVNHNLTDFVVYPQPSKGTLHLLFDAVEKVDVTIYNTEGKVVFEQKNISSREPFYNKLPSGIYILEATHPNGFKKTVNLMMK